jgi:hypothetical protein
MGIRWNREGDRRGARQPSATQDATSAPIAELRQGGHDEPAHAERRVLTAETLCEAEAGLRRPPVELCPTLGVRELCARPG